MDRQVHAILMTSSTIYGSFLYPKPAHCAILQSHTHQRFSGFVVHAYNFVVSGLAGGQGAPRSASFINYPLAIMRSKSFSMNAMTSEVQRRLDYLWRMALAAMEIEPPKVHLARHLAAQMVGLAAAHKVDLLVKSKICKKCAAVLYPGLTLRVRLVRRSRRSPASLRKSKRMRRANVVQLKVLTQLVLTCLVCGHRRRQNGVVVHRPSSKAPAPTPDFIPLPAHALGSSQREIVSGPKLLDAKPRKRPKKRAS